MRGVVIGVMGVILALGWSTEGIDSIGAHELPGLDHSIQARSLAR